MKTILIALSFVLLACNNAQGRIFSRCELARELLRHGFSRGDLENWVCLVESESSRNTAITGHQNADSSIDYGLFQISGLWWCREGYAGGGCNINCRQLLDDDIADDAKCVRHIFSIHNWAGWHGWINKCQEKTLPNIGHECGF